MRKSISILQQQLPIAMPPLLLHILLLPLLPPPPQIRCLLASGTATRIGSPTPQWVSHPTGFSSSIPRATFRHRPLLMHSPSRPPPQRLPLKLRSLLSTPPPPLQSLPSSRRQQLQRENPVSLSRPFHFGPHRLLVVLHLNSSVAAAAVAMAAAMGTAPMAAAAMAVSLACHALRLRRLPRLPQTRCLKPRAQPKRSSKPGPKPVQARSLATSASRSAQARSSCRKNLRMRRRWSPPLRARARLRNRLRRQRLPTRRCLLAPFKRLLLAMFPLFARRLRTTPATHPTVAKLKTDLEKKRRQRLLGPLRPRPTVRKGTRAILRVLRRRRRRPRPRPRPRRPTRASPSSSCTRGSRSVAPWRSAVRVDTRSRATEPSPKTRASCCPRRLPLLRSGSTTSSLINLRLRARRSTIATPPTRMPLPPPPRPPRGHGRGRHRRPQ